MAPATLYDNFKPYHRRLSNGIRRDWSGAQDYVLVAVYRVQHQFLMKKFEAQRQIPDHAKRPGAEAYWKKQLTSLENFGLTF